MAKKEQKLKTTIVEKDAAQCKVQDGSTGDNTIKDKKKPTTKRAKKTRLSQVSAAVASEGQDTASAVSVSAADCTEAADALVEKAAQDNKQNAASTEQAHRRMRSTIRLKVDRRPVKLLCLDMPESRSVNLPTAVLEPISVRLPGQPQQAQSTILSTDVPRPIKKKMSKQERASRKEARLGQSLERKLSQMILSHQHPRAAERTPSISRSPCVESIQSRSMTPEPFRTPTEYDGSHGFAPVPQGLSDGASMHMYCSPQPMMQDFQPSMPLHLHHHHHHFSGSLSFGQPYPPSQPIFGAPVPFGYPPMPEYKSDSMVGVPMNGMVYYEDMAHAPFPSGQYGMPGFAPSMYPMPPPDYTNSAMQGAHAFHPQH